MLKEWREALSKGRHIDRVKSGQFFAEILHQPGIFNHPFLGLTLKFSSSCHVLQQVVDHGFAHTSQTGPTKTQSPS